MKNIIKKIIPRFILRFYHFLWAYASACLCRFPSRKMIIIGVLGTRGKTTTANLIWSGLKEAGYKVGLTSTANIRVGDEERLNDYHMTMPGRFVIQKLLLEMYEKGCTYAIIETPSEGIEQWRHAGIAYDELVLATLYPEYLETHNWSWERAIEMNLRVFTALRGSIRKIIEGKSVPKSIVINTDNKEAEFFLKFLTDKKITYGIKTKADFVARDIEIKNKNIFFTVGEEKYELGISGLFNVYNALGAIASLTALGISQEAIKRGLCNLKGVPGRMEEIRAGQDFTVFVDYAHDEKSLESLLEATRNMRKGGEKIILVLGAEGGGRDKKKRSVMGELAVKMADRVVITNVDPYDDDPKEILYDIAYGALKTGGVQGENLFVIEDRREGIRKALELASRGDIVLITGKGAEQSMIIKDRKIEWDDRLVTRLEIKRIVKNT